MVESPPAAPAYDGRWSTWERRVLRVVLVVLVLAYVAAARLFARSTDSRGLSVNPVPPPGGVTVTFDVVALDTTLTSVRARMTVTPSSELVDPGGSLRRTLVVVAALQGRTEFTFAAGERPGSQDVSLFLSGAPENYPLDRWYTVLAVVAGEPPSSTGTSSARPLPVAVGVDSTVSGWVTREITLAEYQDAVPQARLTGEPATMPLRFSRAGSTMAIAFLVLGLMVVLAVLGMAVALAAARARRRLEPTFAGFLAALLFALIPLRNALPGAPPLGAWIDILVFFWVEIVLMTALALFVWTWLQRGPRPDLPPPASRVPSPPASGVRSTAAPAPPSATG